MKRKYEGNLAVRKTGTRSIQHLGTREIRVLKKQVKMDDPAYLAYKDRIN